MGTTTMPRMVTTVVVHRSRSMPIPTATSMQRGVTSPAPGVQ